MVRKRALGSATLIAVAVAAVACGGGESPTATTRAQATSPSPTAIATAKPAAAAPTATATSKPATTAPTATATTAKPTASAGQPSGTLRVVLQKIGAPVFMNSRLPFPTNTFHFAYGITETLGMIDQDRQPVVNLLAKEWKLDSDNKSVIVSLRQGVQFHKGWGEMTADDVVFNYNDASVKGNPKSRWDDAGEIASIYDKFEVVDKYTVRGVMPEFKADWICYMAFSCGAPVNIFSKAVFDKLGEDKAAETGVATGPFAVEEYVEGDRFVGKAVLNHWRITPEFETLKILEIPEKTSRVAMMKTGEADIGDVPIKEVPALIKAGLKSDSGLKSITGHGIFYGGNYWHKTDPNKNNAPISREGFTPDDQHPWIGDPSKPESLERARKVRWAMSMAIDRKLINDTILGGLGEVNYATFGPAPSFPTFQKKWAIPYDPEKSKQNLKEVGVPQGFKFTYYVSPDFASIVPEVGQAIAEMWRAVGLSPEILSLAYTTHRPRLVNRSINYPWLFVNAGVVEPYDQCRAPLWTSVVSGASPGFEIPKLFDQYNACQAEKDAKAREAINTETIDYATEQQFLSAVVSVPTVLVFNPKVVGSWGLIPYTPINHLEQVTHAK